MNRTIWDMNPRILTIIDLHTFCEIQGPVADIFIKELAMNHMLHTLSKLCMIDIPKLEMQC